MQLIQWHELQIKKFLHSFASSFQFTILRSLWRDITFSHSPYFHFHIQVDFYFHIQVHIRLPVLFHTQQCVTVPKMLNETDTNTFFRYQIFSIPIPVLFSDTNLSRHFFRSFLHQPFYDTTLGNGLFENCIFKKYAFKKHSFKKCTLEKYTFETYNFGKHTFKKYTFEKHTLKKNF